MLIWRTINSSCPHLSWSRLDASGLKLNGSEHTIELLADGVQIDLGAIGKGYAADKIGELLHKWSIDTALISAGQSTILPVGVPRGLKGWPLTLSDPTDYSRVLAKIYLADFAVSASGLQKGAHIINPRSGKPVKRKLAAWATAKTASTGRLTAAAADALSTAFMVMSVDDIRTFCATYDDTSAFIILPAKKKGSANRVKWG
ncbi:MAG: FAD:protein FMN transferase [Planctomycetota bacterium]